MWGPVVAVVGLLAFWKLHRMHRWAHACGAGPAFGYHGRHRGFGPRRAMRWLFQRLETSPGQEKLFAEELEALLEQFRKTGQTFAEYRTSLAAAIRSDAFDADALKAGHEKQEAALKEVREALQLSLAKIHQSLDKTQRQELADLLERGLRGWRRGNWR